MESFDVDTLVANVRQIVAIENRFDQIEQIALIIGPLLTAATIERIEDLLYEGESLADVNLALRAGDHLRCLGAPFDKWWKSVYPKLAELTNERSLENTLDALREQTDLLDSEIKKIREKQEEVSEQEKKIRQLEKNKRKAEADLLKRKNILRHAKKEFTELSGQIDELKKIEEELSPDSVRQAFEMVLNADRSTLAAIEKSVKAIAAHAGANLSLCETILKDDTDIVSALSAVKEQANSAELLDAGKLADDARVSFDLYIKAIKDLEDKIRNYLDKRDATNP